jgi:hypothetical protein
MEKAIAGFFIVLFMLPLLALLSMITALLWYCFDDYLAAQTGVAWLGNIPFLNMWAFTLFMGCIFKGSSSATSK